MNATPAICAVIFDMDGVLTDSEPLINAAAVAMFREKGLEVQPEDFLPFVGTGEDRYISGVAEKHHFALDLVEAKRRTYELYLELVPSRLEAFPGAQSLVRACRQGGLFVAVASSADRIKIDANLCKIGLPPEEWNSIVSGEDVSLKKPAPDIFLSAAAKLGLAPEECVVIEDAVNGVQAAKAAGMRCVAVAQTFAAERLVQADLVREKISDLTVADLVGPGGLSRLSVAPQPDGAGLTPGSAALSPRPWGFWMTAVLTLATGLAGLVVQLAVVFVWALMVVSTGDTPSPKEAASNGLLLSLSTIVSAPVLLALVYLFIRLRRGLSVSEYLGLRAVSGRELLPWTLCLLALVCASDWLTLALGREIAPEFMQTVYRTAGFRPLLWFVLVVAAPVSEETLFRGFLFKGVLHSRLRAGGAIFLSAASWAAIHLQYDAYGIGTVFVGGVLLGYARLKTRSLCTPIFMHGLMNLIATLEVALF
jgi:HAD superfamily hydrolase (TIGR01509 family)